MTGTLSDQDIRRAKQWGWLDLQPWSEEDVQPASVDVHLARDFMLFDDRYVGQPIEAARGVESQMIRWEGEAYVIRPGGFLLGRTVERVRLAPNVLARVEGKSSLGRLGLVVHVTAGFIDPGFEGTITLELANLSPRPIIVRAGMKIAQLAFAVLSSPAVVPYGPARGSKYQGQREVTPSRPQFVTPLDPPVANPHCRENKPGFRCPSPMEVNGRGCAWCPYGAGGIGNTD